MSLDKPARQVTIQSMNLNRAIRLSLLMLFALLQCVAPLAHAHVNGQHADHDVHIVHIVHIELSDAPWYNDHDAAAHHLSAGEHHSAVVCMPTSYRFNIQASVQAVVVNLQSFPLSCVAGALPLLHTERQLAPLLPYQHPYSQAPPA